MRWWQVLLHPFKVAKEMKWMGGSLDRLVTESQEREENIECLLDDNQELRERVEHFEQPSAGERSVRDANG